MEMAEYFHVSLDYQLLGETESNSKAKRDSLIMVYFQHPSFGSHSVTGTLVVCKINNYTYISHYVILNTPKFTEVFRDGKINTISAFRRRS